MDGRLAIDTAVLLLYFVLIISIGLYMGRKEENLKDFALGGRAIPWWAVLASLIAAETSAGTFFGTPGEGFSHRDYTYLQLAFGTIIGRILVSYIFIKPYYDSKVFSIYEYLTARFRNALVRRRDCPCPCLRDDQRLPAKRNPNPLDLSRGHRRHRHSYGDL